MDPIAKNTRKKAKKASSGGGRSSGRGEKQLATLPADIQAAWRDEEELVDYEPEYPPPFSPIQDDMSVQGDHTPTQEEEPHYFPPDTDDFPASLAEDDPMAGRKRSRFFPALPARQVLLKIPPRRYECRKLPPSTNNDVEMAGEPADARGKRRRGPEGATHWVWFFPICPSCPILPGLNLSFHAQQQHFPPLRNNSLPVHAKQQHFHPYRNNSLSVHV